MVSITLRVLSRPDVEHLPRIYQSLGLDYDERVLPSIGNEVLKAIVAQFDAAELITQREVVCIAVFPWWKLINQVLANRSHLAFVLTCFSVPESSISNSRMSLSPI